MNYLPFSSWMPKASTSALSVYLESVGFRRREIGSNPALFFCYERMRGESVTAYEGYGPEYRARLKVVVSTRSEGLLDNLSRFGIDVQRLVSYG